MTALVSNAMDLYKNRRFSNSSLQSAEKEFLAALLLSADKPMTWKEILALLSFEWVNSVNQWRQIHVLLGKKKA